MAQCHAAAGADLLIITWHGELHRQVRQGRCDRRRVGAELPLTNGKGASVEGEHKCLVRARPIAARSTPLDTTTLRGSVPAQRVGLTQEVCEVIVDGRDVGVF